MAVERRGADKSIVPREMSNSFAHLPPERQGLPKVYLYLEVSRWKSDAGRGFGISTGGGISTSGTTSGTTVDRSGGKTTSAASARRRRGRTSCVGWPRTIGRRSRRLPGEGRESKGSSRRRPRIAAAV